MWIGYKMNIIFALFFDKKLTSNDWVEIAKNNQPKMVNHAKLVINFEQSYAQFHNKQTFDEIPSEGNRSATEIC